MRGDTPFGVVLVDIPAGPARHSHSGNGEGEGLVKLRGRAILGKWPWAMLPCLPQHARLEERLHYLCDNHHQCAAGHGGGGGGGALGQRALGGAHVEQQI